MVQAVDDRPGVPSQAPDEKPEERIPSPERWTRPGAADDLELLAEKQVLDHESLAAANGADDDGQDEADDCRASR